MGDNVETIKRAIAAWNSGEISVYHDLYTDDVTAVAGMLWPEADGPVVGRHAIISNFESILTVFDSSEIVAEDFIGGDERIVVPILLRGVPRGGGAAVEQRMVLAYRFRDGLIAFHGFFITLHDALDAVELPRSLARSTG